MKAVILAGGAGTRIAEETVTRPKPLVEIGGRPILWHILKIYSVAGINDFIVCLGYKGYLIKQYFADYFLRSSDVTFDLVKNRMDVHAYRGEPWRITLVDTGEETLTGGRIRRIREHVGDDPFCLTYGDGVGDIDVANLIAAHRESGRWATVTAVQPPGRYGVLTIEGTRVTRFDEKPPGDGHWINGGFFVFGPELFRYLKDDRTVLEEEPLRALAALGQLHAFHHTGFWHSLNRMSDKAALERLWASGNAPWRVWRGE